MSNFGERILQARNALKLSQTRLSVAFYELDYIKTLSRTAVAQWETGVTKEIEADNLLRICHVLDISPYWILYGDDDNWYNRLMKKA